MKRIAVFPGSFDPITKGHEDIILRGLSLFDEIIIGIGTNTTKSYLFSEEKRIELVKKCFEKENKVKVVSYDGLTVDFCKKQNAAFILRGLRSGIDFEYERAIELMNKGLKAEIETVFLFTNPEFLGISSTIVREIYRNKGDISRFVPVNIKLDS